MLKRVGYYKEMGEGYERFPNMRSYISDAAQPDEDKIIAYLKSGVMLLGCPGYEHDVLDPQDRTVLYYHILTDGEWKWRHDLAHYLRKYHLLLDPEFVKHMRSSGWKVPPESEMDPRIFKEC